MLAVLFPSDQLRIMDYNRAVRDLNGLTDAAFLKRVGENFRISPNFTAKSRSSAMISECIWAVRGAV